MDYGYISEYLRANLENIQFICFNLNIAFFFFSSKFIYHYYLFSFGRRVVPEGFRFAGNRRRDFRGGGGGLKPLEINSGKNKKKKKNRKGMHVLSAIKIP